MNADTWMEVEETEWGESSYDFYEWTVAEGDEGERVDKWVAERIDRSRTLTQDYIDKGLLLVNGKTVKANYKLRPGDRITLEVPEPEEIQVEPENIPLDIVYEDADVIVVNKPRGMVVHPAAGHMTGTLVNALMYHCTDLSEIGGELRPGIVHRIDKDTSGLIMAAKNDRAHQSLSHQLKEHTVTRKYVALVHGVVNHDLGTIDAPIGRHPVQRKEMAVRKDGRHAVTHFHVLERYDGYTLLECKLETGRTHQIRVHMQFIGHPLVGDPVYGPKRTLPGIDGQALHAQVLGFHHPRTGEYMEFSRPMPEDMQRLVERLRLEMD
jgi:23S rRNA pseudouridine1911/1915/1917 synthase